MKYGVPVGGKVREIGARGEPNSCRTDRERKLLKGKKRELFEGGGGKKVIQGKIQRK